MTRHSVKQYSTCMMSNTPGAKTIKKNTNSTQNKTQTQRGRAYEVRSSHRDVLKKPFIVLAPGRIVEKSILTTERVVGLLKRVPSSLQLLYAGSVFVVPTPTLTVRMAFRMGHRRSLTGPMSRACRCMGYRCTCSFLPRNVYIQIK